MTGSKCNTGSNANSNTNSPKTILILDFSEKTSYAAFRLPRKFELGMTSLTS